MNRRPEWSAAAPTEHAGRLGERPCITMDGMAGLEPRAFRNWYGIINYGMVVAVFALGALRFGPVLSLLAVPFCLLLLASIRQHVIVFGTEVELQHVLWRHRLPLSEIERLSVIYTFARGWRIRLHDGPEHVDTFSFVNPFAIRVSDGHYPAPPADAPLAVKELFALLSARMPRRTSGTTFVTTTDSRGDKRYRRLPLVEPRRVVDTPGRDQPHQ